MRLIKFYGAAFGGEAASLSIVGKAPRRDGLTLGVEVAVLEYRFSVETFFFGYNLDAFVRQIEEGSFSEKGIAKLINYDETLVMTFVRVPDGKEFLSIDYRSIAPERPAPECVSILSKISGATERQHFGSRFELQFLLLHSPIEEIGREARALLDASLISVANPYPVGEAKASR